LADNFPGTRFNASWNEKSLTVVSHSLFSAWMLAFIFKGQILLSLADVYRIDSTQLIYSGFIAIFTGLLLSGFVIKSKKAAKRLFLSSYLIFIAISAIFFFPPSHFWLLGILLGSFLAGACVASWGIYLKSSTPRRERIKTVADMLILSNILMIPLNVIAIHLSPHLGLGISMLMLCVAFILALKLPEDLNDDFPTLSKVNKSPESITKLLVFLCLFIIVVTITSGLMYEVVNPAFIHLEQITSWYWATPYIIALIIMRSLSLKINRVNVLFIALAMIGLGFIAFIILDRGIVSYFVINTLILMALGVFDLFWWSILADTLDLHQNPTKILGVGMSANILGIFVGGLIGSAITQADTQSFSSSLVALAAVCVALALLPPLNNYLSSYLQDQFFLSDFSKLPPPEQVSRIERTANFGNLSDRELQVTSLLLQGKTYNTIANELFISQNTVKYYVKNIYTKFNIRSRAELFNLVLKNGNNKTG